MDIETLGAIGELASAAGVIVSLLYLARQVRHANAAAVATATNAVSTFFSMHLLQVSGNRELCAVMDKQIRGEQLDPVDRIQMLFMLRSQLIAFENYFNQYRLGFMDRAGWESRRGIVAGILEPPVMRTLWHEQFAREQHPAFVAEMNAELARRDRARGA